MNTKKITMLFLLSLSISVLPNTVYGWFGNGSPPVEIPVDGFLHQEKLQAGELVQYRFRDRTRLMYQANVSTNISIGCDADGIGEQYFRLGYNATEQNAEIRVQLNATNECLNLTNMAQVRLQNGSLYRFRHRFVFNISRNTTDDMMAMLCFRTTDIHAIWAWYNETSGKFVGLESWMDGDYLCTNITHFSTYVVLSTTIASNWWIYAIIAAIGVGIVVLIYVVMNRRKNRKNPKVNDDCPSEDRLPDGSCPPKI